MGKMTIKVFAGLTGMLVSGLLLAEVTFRADQYQFQFSGHGENGYFYGHVDAQKNSDEVTGYIYDSFGNQTFFHGEWTGNREIEGYDKEGNFIQIHLN